MPRIGPKLNEYVQAAAEDGVTSAEVSLVAQEVARRSSEPGAVMEKVVERFADAFSQEGTTEQATRAARSLARLSTSAEIPSRRALADAVAASIRLFETLDQTGLPPGSP